MDTQSHVTIDYSTGQYLVDGIDTGIRANVSEDKESIRMWRLRQRLQLAESIEEEQ